MTVTAAALHVPPALVARIDEWRERQPGKISRKDALRYLLDSRLTQLQPTPAYASDMPGAMP